MKLSDALQAYNEFEEHDGPLVEELATLPSPSHRVLASTTYGAEQLEELNPSRREINLIKLQAEDYMPNIMIWGFKICGHLPLFYFHTRNWRPAPRFLVRWCHSIIIILLLLWRAMRNFAQHFPEETRAENVAYGVIKFVNIVAVLVGASVMTGCKPIARLFRAQNIMAAIFYPTLIGEDELELDKSGVPVPRRLTSIEKELRNEREEFEKRRKRYEQRIVRLYVGASLLLSTVSMFVFSYTRFADIFLGTTTSQDSSEDHYVVSILDRFYYVLLIVSEWYTFGPAVMLALGFAATYYHISLLQVDQLLLDLDANTGLKARLALLDSDAYVIDEDEASSSAPTLPDTEEPHARLFDIPHQYDGAAGPSSTQQQQPRTPHSTREEDETPDDDDDGSDMALQQFNANMAALDAQRDRHRADSAPPPPQEEKKQAFDGGSWRNRGNLSSAIEPWMVELPSRAPRPPPSTASHSAASTVSSGSDTRDTGSPTTMLQTLQTLQKLQQERQAKRKKQRHSFQSALPPPLSEDHDLVTAAIGQPENVLNTLSPSEPLYSLMGPNDQSASLIPLPAPKRRGHAFIEQKQLSARLASDQPLKIGEREELASVLPLVDNELLFRAGMGALNDRMTRALNVCLEEVTAIEEDAARQRSAGRRQLTAHLRKVIWFLAEMLAHEGDMRDKAVFPGVSGPVFFAFLYTIIMTGTFIYTEGEHPPYKAFLGPVVTIDVVTIILAVIPKVYRHRTWVVERFTDLVKSYRRTPVLDRKDSDAASDMVSIASSDLLWNAMPSNAITAGAAAAAPSAFAGGKVKAVAAQAGYSGGWGGFVGSSSEYSVGSSAARGTPRRDSNSSVASNEVVALDPAPRAVRSPSISVSSAASEESVDVAVGGHPMAPRGSKVGKTLSVINVDFNNEEHTPNFATAQGQVGARVVWNSVYWRLLLHATVCGIIALGVAMFRLFVGAPRCDVIQGGHLGGFTDEDVSSCSESERGGVTADSVVNTIVIGVTIFLSHRRLTAGYQKLSRVITFIYASLTIFFASLVLWRGLQSDYATTKYNAALIASGGFISIMYTAHVLRNWKSMLCELGLFALLFITYLLLVSVFAPLYVNALTDKKRLVLIVVFLPLCTKVIQSMAAHLCTRLAPELRASGWVFLVVVQLLLNTFTRLLLTNLNGLFEQFFAVIIFALFELGARAGAPLWRFMFWLAVTWDMKRAYEKSERYRKDSIHAHHIYIDMNSELFSIIFAFLFSFIVKSYYNVGSGDLVVVIGSILLQFFGETFADMTSITIEENYHERHMLSLWRHTQTEYFWVQLPLLLLCVAVYQKSWIFVVLSQARSR